MLKYIIQGGKPLHGEINISGAKNAAVAILPAALLVDGVCRIENVPQISDVGLILEILRELGANVRTINRNCFEIDCSRVKRTSVSYELSRQFRASYYFLGALLGRLGTAQVAMPGGCNLGARPIDLHIKGFEALGANVEVKNGNVQATAPYGGLRGCHIQAQTSVGTTMNLMMAAVFAKGTTIIENAAKEPHIVDLANFINAMGGNIMGAGTDTIKVRGVTSLIGGTYSIIPDQIEAGTYMAAVATAGGSVLIRNVIPKHMDCITSKLTEMGVQVEELGDDIRITRIGPMTPTHIKTMPYPGFPTDMQSQIAVCLCLAQGTSVVTETIWDNRFRYCDELKRMGAKVQVDGKVAVFEGVSKLTGAPVRACDLRAGAAMVIAGLAAEGTTEIDHIHHVERGYEDIVTKLRNVGADIQLVEFPDDTGIRSCNAG